MKYFYSIFLLLLSTSMLTSCASNSESGIVDPSRPHLEILFSFNTESYPKFIKTAYPQIAVWVADGTNTYTQTVYATGKGAKNGWWGASAQPSALPVWYGIKMNEGSEKIDSVSGATPSGSSFKISWPVPDKLAGKKLNVFIESNVSFDYNENYKKETKKGEKGYSDVNGQPSLVWKATILLKGEESQAVPVIAGHGQVLGENHSIDTDISGITTAKNLFHYLKVIYRDGSQK